MTGFKKICLVLCALFACSIFAVAGNIHWSVSSELISADTGKWRLTFTGKIDEGYHSYPLSDEFSGPSIEFSELSGCTLDGGLVDLSRAVKEGEYLVVNDALVLTQDLLLDPGCEKAVVKGTCITICCAGNSCFPPEYIDFEKEVLPGQTAASSPEAGSPEQSGQAAPFDWSLILQAILWGFAMILTPCVFPMIPMTVSFFLKSSSSAAAGRFNAFMYGLFIVLLYTLPITVIILITWIAGGDAVTADIFNWLATHWLPNIVFFIVFMVFAASFFGAFEITLPSSWVNRADGKSGKKGLVGVFFMALTLVLVSFSCTGPIVGTVLIQSTQGQFWMPIVTMFAFSVAFALPFTVFALFPSLLNKLKSGSWLSSVKVVLGFIEVALGFKFLSVADQTYHWGLLDREVYLAIWIVVFSMLGFYLLGKLRFPHDEKVEHVSLLRLISSIAVFSFVVYMIPGMFGAPLKALSGYLPPISTQDFVIGKASASTQAQVSETANQ